MNRRELMQAAAVAAMTPVQPCLAAVSEGARFENGRLVAPAIARFYDEGGRLIHVAMMEVGQDYLPWHPGARRMEFES